MTTRTCMPAVSRRYWKLFGGHLNRTSAVPGLHFSDYQALATNLFVLKFPLSRMFLASCNVLYHERKPGYPLSTVATRDELKALIDQLPEPRLEIVRNMLEHHVHPPQPRPEIEQMQRRSQEYKERVEQRFRETGKPGTIRGMAGGGGMRMHQGTPFGRQSFPAFSNSQAVTAQ